MFTLRPLQGVLAGLSLLVIAASTARGQTAPVSNEQVTAAIKRGVAWVYQQQNQWGTWERAQEPTGTAPDLADQGQFGELTALAMQALLTAGETDRDPRIGQAMDFVIDSDRILGTCAVGLRAQVWPLLTASPAVRQAMARDRNILLAAMHNEGRTRGLFSFRTDGRGDANDFDRDASFHAILALNALADAEIEIPDEAWRTMQRAWRAQQGRDGSWTARGTPMSETRPVSALGMTADGAAALLAADDELASSHPADCEPVPSDRYIESALTWIDNHFDHLRDANDFGGFSLRNFGLYAIARIGQISGRQYFNERDWYQDGARTLLNSQLADGSWGNLPDTCFAIIFLTRGRNPVMVSKLEYSVFGAGLGVGRGGRGLGGLVPPRFGAGGPVRAGSWNLRPRDVANLTAWVGRQVEESFNWETVSLRAPAENLHDSAVLYMAGNQPLLLSAEDRTKLKLFIEQGGMVVGNADCGSEAFSESFRRLGSELFPAYEFRNISIDSIIYTGEEYRAAAWKALPQVLELNNGVRDLMLLIPQQDPSRYFQQRQIGSRQYLYELLADILFYSVDQSGERLKGDSFLVLPDSSAPIQRTVKLARLAYDGNWNPEPGGWVRLAAVMRNTRGIDLQVSPVRLGSGQLNASFKLAHLTGTTIFYLDDAARKELAAFVRGGGTLVIDAAGGTTAFDAAAQTEIKSVFSDPVLEMLDGDNPVFSAGVHLTRPAFRRFARSRLVQTDHFRLRMARFGKGAIYYSAEDLSAGLVGEPVDGIYGYQPRVATDLMANIIDFTAGN